MDDQGMSASSDTVTTGLTVWVAVGPGCQSSAARVQAGRLIGLGTVAMVASSTVPLASVVVYVPAWVARTITSRPSRRTESASVATTCTDAGSPAQPGSARPALGLPPAFPTRRPPRPAP